MAVGANRKGKTRNDFATAIHLAPIVSEKPTLFDIGVGYGVRPDANSYKVFTHGPFLEGSFSPYRSVNLNTALQINLNQRIQLVDGGPRLTTSLELERYRFVKSTQFETVNYRDLIGVCDRKMGPGKFGFGAFIAIDKHLKTEEASMFVGFTIRTPTYIASCIGVPR